MRGFILFIFILLYGLLTFFGLGPVLLADGTLQERMLTLAVVIVLYIVLTLLLRWLLSCFKK